MNRALIVCIGGWACPDSLWSRVTSLISDYRDVKVISAHEIIKDRASFWKKLSASEQGKKITVIGWSLGGILALEAQLKKYCQFESLLLLSSCARMCADGCYTGVELRDLQAMRVALTRNNSKTIKDFWKSIFSSQDYEREITGLLKSVQELGVNNLELGLKFLEEIDLRSELSNISIPVTIIHGKEDKIIPFSSAKFLLENITDSKLITLEKAGHDLPLYCPEIIAEEALRKSSSHIDSSRSFSSAANSYDACSQVQQEIGQYLLEFSAPFITSPTSALDIGCGTGFFAKLLIDKYPKITVVGLDNAEGMILSCKERFCHEERLSFIEADAHSFKTQNKFNLIASNCMLQWSNELEKVIKSQERALDKNGLLIFSTLVLGSLIEISTCYKEISGGALPSIKMYPHSLYLESLETYGLEILASEQMSFTSEFTNALDALISLKKIGATTPRLKYKPLSPMQIKELCDLYEKRFSSKNGFVPCSYQVLFVVAKKRDQSLG